MQQMNFKCDWPKIQTVIFVTKGKALNNFDRHIHTNNVDAIKKQIKRGSVKIIKKR